MKLVENRRVPRRSAPRDDRRFRHIVRSTSSGRRASDIQPRTSSPRITIDIVTRRSPETRRPGRVSGDRRRIRNGLGQVRAALGNVQTELLGARGRRIPVQLNLGWVLDGDRRISGVIGVAKDISEMRKLAVRLSIPNGRTIWLPR